MEKQTNEVAKLNRRIGILERANKLLLLKVGNDTDEGLRKRIAELQYFDVSMQKKAFDNGKTQAISEFKEKLKAEAEKGNFEECDENGDGCWIHTFDKSYFLSFLDKTAQELGELTE